MTPRRTDLALCLAVVTTLSIVVSSDQGPPGGLRPLAYLWPIGLGALMLVRRSHPMLLLVATVIGFFSYYASGFPAIGVAVPIAAALYSASEMGYERAAALTGAAAVVVSTAFRLAVGQDARYVVGYELLGHVALIVAVIALGRSVRVSRSLRRRTEQLSGLLDRQRVLDEDAQTRQERLRLARELHDSIGHSLSVAAMYANVARDAADDDGDGDARRSALGLVRSSVSDALSQLRHTVALLRSGGLGGQPAGPGVTDIGTLVEAPRAAGFVVALSLDDRPVPEEVGTAAFRVVQEAVTNVLRHSSGSTIDVSVTRESHSLVVAVRDDGGRSTAPRFRPGQGLTGMRERVAQLGGHLAVEAGPQGWQVRATIPTRRPP